MAKRRSPTPHNMQPPRADDLKRITGIGPAVEKRLNGVSISRFEQLAALSPADIAAAVADLTGLTAERIIKQDWIGQARRLASEAGLESGAETGVEVEVEEKGAIESEPEAEAEEVEEAETERETEVAAESVTATSMPAVDTEVEGAPLPGPGEAKAGLTGTPLAHGMEIIEMGSKTHRKTLAEDETFEVHITLDLTGLQVTGSDSLHYKASVYGRDLSHSGLVIGESQGSIGLADTVTIAVAGKPMPAGTYHIAATVIVGLPGMELKPMPGKIAVVQGGVIQVY
jgi:hypothetical protein